MSFGSQDEIVAFLSALDGGARKIATTHISVVVVCETRAFKLKRAVTLPYLDFSTPEKRLAMCEREVALNRRTAPSLYIGVRRVTRAADGRLAFDGVGETIDAVVEMRRFEEDNLFDRLAAARRLDGPMIETLAARIAAFHDAAPPDFSGGGQAAIADVVAMNEASSRAARVADAKEIGELFARFKAAVLEEGSLLDARRAAGKIRHCHGDLTLRNICLLDGAPTPFDCLEFSDELATIDVLYDLAFLLMDLVRAKQENLANLAFNRYLDARDETDGSPLLPLFMALRAAIRAHVGATQGKQDEARGYFDLAGALLKRNAPQIVAIGGYSGCGKSSVARRLAASIGAAPGARVVNSDRIRKKLFGVAPTARLPQEAYASEVSARVYDAMFAAAKRTTNSRWPVIVDAVFDRPQDRATIEKIAHEAGAPFRGFWLDADIDQRARRIEARVNDVSDATREVLLAQVKRDPGVIRWTRIDAGRELSAIAEEVAARLRV